MPWSRADRAHANRGWICGFVIAVFTAALLPLATTAPASAATLDRVREAGKIVLGYRADARPFAFRDETGKASGYAVALCQKIADQVKVELKLSTLAVEWTPVTVSDQFRAVQENKVDLLCGVNETLSRRKDVDFSIPIFPGGIGALLRADASIGLQEVLLGRQSSGPIWRGSPAQILEKQVFSVVKETPSESWLADKLDKFQLTAKVVPVDGYEAGIRRVVDRSSNVFFADRSVLLDAAMRSPSASELTVLDRMFTYGPFALALARGNDDFRLVVDTTLSRLFGSDDFHSLYVKWFGQPDENAIMFFRLSALPE
jgi:ABC-type amino acid transport substrate-binding protein